MEIKIRQLEHGKDMPLPQYASLGSAGMDLMAAVNDDVVIKPGERHLIPTGLSIELEQGVEAQVRPRSGLALKHGITVLNSPGTVDSDYRGEISVILINLGQEDFIITRGMRIAQMIIARVEQAKFALSGELSATSRGEGGFGSTGLKQVA